jgi:hypothetical protein
MATWRWLGDVQIGADGQLITTGTGAPEGVITAPVGSIYLRLDGAANSSLYTKESGVGNTGWTAIGAAGTAISFYTNNTPNLAQNSLNLTAGNGMALSNPSAGQVIIDGPKFKVQGTDLIAQTPVNFQAGTGIAITNPSAGVVLISNVMANTAFQVDGTLLSGFAGTVNFVDGVNSTFVDNGGGSVQVNVISVAPGAVTTILTTASLNTLNSQSGAYNSHDTQSSSLVLEKAGILLRVQVDRAARVRLYTTAAARDADLTRPNTIPPTPGIEHGVCVDLYLDGINASLDWHLSPVAFYYNGDSTQTTSIYYSVTNLSAGTSTVQVTFTHVQAEG